MPDQEWQRELWDMGQRVAMQIAEKPQELRKAALEIAERHVRDMVVEMKIFAADKVDGMVALQMQVIREMVEKIDAGGSPKGGNA